MDLLRLSSPSPALSPASGHAVQFYDRDFAAESIARFLAEGLAVGHAGVVIATAEHRQAIHEALHEVARGAAAAEAAGRLLFLDAADTLAALSQPSGEPTLDGLRRHVAPVLASLCTQWGRVRAYGEMVDLLARAGRVDAAVVLEQAWNALLAEHPVDLLCGYQIGAFDDGDETEGFRRVCGTHSHVRVLECGDDATGLRHDRLVAELQQKTRLARIAAEQLARLQRVTAALAEASTSSQVAELVGGELAAIVEADEAELALPVEAHGRPALRRLRSLAARPHAVGHDFASVALDAALPVSEAFRLQAPLWLSTRDAIEERFGHAHEPGLHAVAGVPVSAGGQQLGALAFGYTRERAFTAADRGLLADVARQVGVALDRARLYEEANLARQQAESASSAKDEFLAMLGHELRNPLSPIVTALHLMKLRGSGELERERGLIERQVSHLLRLVEDLLDVSRITRGKMQLQRDSVELAEVVAQAIETVGPLVAQRAHRLLVEVPTDGLLVEGDATRLAQVVANLLMNAAKYTPSEGRIQVRAAADGDEAVIAIRDNGMGIAPELLPTVFDLFVQGPRARDRSEGGLGLGLAIVHSLVKLHGGTVAVTSAGLGKGAEFTVRLPLAPRSRRGLGVAAASAQRSYGQGLRVLVVDDNVDAAQTLAELLEAMGCEARVAHDGPAALIAAQEQQPDLVLLDIGLPVMDGYEVAMRLRRQGRARLHLAALTGYGQPEDCERSRRAGFDAHFVKPMAPEALQALVVSLAAGQGSTASA